MCFCVKNNLEFIFCHTVSPNNYNLFWIFAFAGATNCSSGRWIDHIAANRLAVEMSKLKQQFQDVTDTQHQIWTSIWLPEEENCTIWPLLIRELLKAKRRIWMITAVNSNLHNHAQTLMKLEIEMLELKVGNYCFKNVFW